jgi:hypothetical protein
VAKKPNIKWRASDGKALERYVRNYNAKVKRLVKKDPSNAQYYPETLKLKDVKSKIKTRQDFNRETAKIKRFSQKGVEKIKETPTGLKATAYELKEASIMQRIVNTRRKREIERLGLTPERGVSTQVEKATLYPKKPVTKVKPQDFRKYLESLEKEVGSKFLDQAKEQYKKNYLKGLYDELGEGASKIEALLINMDSNFIVDNSLGNPYLTIDFQYDDQISIESRIDRIYEEWLLLI